MGFIEYVGLDISISLRWYKLREVSCMGFFEDAKAA